MRTYPLDAEAVPRTVRRSRSVRAASTGSLTSTSAKRHDRRPTRSRRHRPSRRRRRDRRKVEALFGELKNQIGLRRLRLRRMRFVREQFYLAAAAQNLKRLVRFLSMRPEPVIVTA